MTAVTHRRWSADGWRGWIAAGADVDPLACLARAAAAGGRTSRHARTVALAAGRGRLFVKTWPAPGGWRARRAFRMAVALAAAGFATPPVVAAAERGGEGLLITDDVGGEALVDALVACRDRRRDRRALLAGVGREVGRLHRAGFVHGDLVPPNLRLRDATLVFLDNDRTRRGTLLVRLAGRRNLVQLGRFVVPGVTLTDRARVLRAYARERGLSAAARRRLGRWLVAKTTARRCAIDGIPPAAAARAGFRALMRSGGPFDPAGRDAGATGVAG
jgi:Lipopolysaccharide kinase (Kdo/WaaP) family